MVSTESDTVIGRNLVTVRGEMSQAQLAKLMRGRGHKWSQATVWAIEKGERPLRLVEALDLSGLLKIEPRRLWMGGVQGAVVDACERVWWERTQIQIAVEKFDRAQGKLRELVERVGSAGLEKEVQEALDYTVETAVSEARELRQLGGGNGEHPEAP